MRAVVTADIVNSTKISPETEQRLLRELAEILRPFSVDFFRGDSFQVYFDNPEEALILALRCRAMAVGLDAGGEVTDVRASLGLGEVQEPIDILGQAKGSAFVLSGRSIDAIQKTETRLAIVSENPLANVGLEVIANYLDAIWHDMTAKQAGVIAELLRGAAQQKVAKELNKSKSTISQLASAGRWPEIERLLQQYENIINLIV